jgi:hypothetical protein
MDISTVGSVSRKFLKKKFRDHQGCKKRQNESKQEVLLWETLGSSENE